MIHKVSLKPHDLCGGGLDIGGTLCKVVVVRPGEELSSVVLHECSCEDILDYVMKAGVQFCGATGSRAVEFRHCAQCRRDSGVPNVPQVLCVNEFVAWGNGAAKLLPSSCGVEFPYLLGSIGTGTSILLVNGFTITRVGGSALGGGTILGLGRVAIPGISFGDLCRLASLGNRCEVDLLLKDIYAPGQIGIADNITASNFGKLAGDKLIPRPSDADIAAGIISMVGENIALVVSEMMNIYHTHTIVYGGSTLCHNTVLRSVLMRAGELLHHRAVILDRGEFTGAVGAYELALAY